MDFSPKNQFSFFDENMIHRRGSNFAKKNNGQKSAKKIRAKKVQKNNGQKSEKK